MNRSSSNLRKKWKIMLSNLSNFKKNRVEIMDKIMKWVFVPFLKKMMKKVGLELKLNYSYID